MYDLTYFRTDHSRERQLWCAVIGRAVLDATWPDGPTGITRERARQREEARRWFVDGGHDFCVACEVAGFDANTLRNKMLLVMDVTVETTARPAIGASKQIGGQKVPIF